MVQRARDEVDRILKEHVPDPPLESSVVEQLNKVVAGSLSGARKA
jgi:trimethylamine:corrinoid methyltransferase-like protein